MTNNFDFTKMSRGELQELIDNASAALRNAPEMTLVCNTSPRESLDVRHDETMNILVLNYNVNGEYVGSVYVANTDDIRKLIVMLGKTVKAMEA